MSARGERGDPIELNRLSVPGEQAARERVEALFAEIDRLGPHELSMTAIPRRDRESREIQLAELERVADRNGRGALLDEARERVRDALLARVAEPLVPRSLFAAAGRVGRAEDMVEIVEAIEDAVSVAVVEDRLEPGTAHRLAQAGLRVLGLPTPADAPVDPGPADPAEGAEPGRAAAWEPSAQDWAAAVAGETAIERDADPMPDPHPLRAIFLGVAAVIATLAAIAWLTGGGLPG